MSIEIRGGNIEVVLTSELEVLAILKLKGVHKKCSPFKKGGGFFPF